MTQTFDFFATSRYISKHTGAKFGEGAEVIMQLLKEVDLQKEFDEVNAALKTESKTKEKKLLRRLEVINAFLKSGNRPEWMVLDVCLLYTSRCV